MNPLTPVFLITQDWFRQLRHQKTFIILAWFAAIAGLSLVFLKIESDRVNLFFSFDISLKDAPEGTDEVVLYMVLQQFVGTLPFVVMLVGVFATAGIVPEMHRRGRLEAMLARPIARWQVVIGTYLGGLGFTLFLSAIMVFCSWIGFAARGRFLHPVYFLEIPVAVLQFALVYAVTLFLGYATRSTGIALLGSLLIWFVGKLAAVFYTQRQAALQKPGNSSPMEEALTGPVGSLVELGYRIFPKPGEFSQLSEIILRQVVGTDVGTRLARQADATRVLIDPDWATIVGSSSVQLAFLFFLSCWVLRNRDFLAPREWRTAR